MKFWQPYMLMMIASKVGKPVGLNNFTIRYWKAGFARVRVKIDSSEPLKMKVSIGGQEGIFLAALHV